MSILKEFENLLIKGEKKIGNPAYHKEINSDGKKVYVKNHSGDDKEIALKNPHNQKLANSYKKKIDVLAKTAELAKRFGHHNVVNAHLNKLADYKVKLKDILSRKDEFVNPRELPPAENSVIQKSLPGFPTAWATQCLLPDVFFEKLGTVDIPQFTNKKSGSYVRSVGSGSEEILDSFNISGHPDYVVLAHELGHVMHIHKKIISPRGILHDSKIKKIIQDGVKELSSYIQENGEEKFDSDYCFFYLENKYRDIKLNTKDINIVTDVIGSLSKGTFGGGHDKSYYKEKGVNEIFTHFNANFFTQNKPLEAVLPKMSQQFNEYFYEFYFGGK